MNVKYSKGSCVSHVYKSEEKEKSMDRIKKEMDMFFVALSASYRIVKILVNNYCWHFVAYRYTCVSSEKSPKNDQKSQCGHRRGGFRRYWCSGFDITSRWSSKGPFNSSETILRHVEYLIFWFSMKFGEISNFTVFSYHFTHENSTFFNIAFDL